MVGVTVALPVAFLARVAGLVCARVVALTALVAVTMTVAGTARANLIFSGTGIDSDHSAISATVEFSLIGNIFQLVLTNNDVSNSQASVLTNVGFNAVPVPASALPSSAGSASITAGSSIVALGTPDSNSVGQEWAYLSGGAASSGFGVGTGDGNLCGSPGCGVMLDGSAFGLVGTGTNLNQVGMTSRTYIENSITIDIALPTGSTFAVSQITSVNFQYGTGAGEGSIRVTRCTAGTDCHRTPEHASLFLLGVGLVSLGAARRYLGRP